MARVLFQFPQSDGPLLTRAEAERMSDADLLQAIVFTIAVAKDRTLTDNDVANFWLVYEERNKRTRRILLPALSVQSIQSTHNKEFTSER
jgi:hypothetical protein